MSRIHPRTHSSYLGRVAAVFSATIAAAAAAEGGRQPNALDLRTLGIDPEAFSKIRLR